MTEYSREYLGIFSNFQNCVRCEKDLKNNKHNSLHLVWKYAQIFALGHYLFLEARSFLKLHSQETVHFSEQMMSVDNYPSIFSPKMEATVYILPSSIRDHNKY